jgi:hypothetical protein
MRTKSLFLGAIILLLFFTALSCKKSGSGDDTITYEVKVTSGTWSGDYYDFANGTQALKFVNHKPDGWKYTFTIAHGKQAGLLISALPDNSGAIVTANIYKNGQLIASDEGQYGANAQIVINQ